MFISQDRDILKPWRDHYPIYAYNKIALVPHKCMKIIKIIELYTLEKRLYLKITGKYVLSIYSVSRSSNVYIYYLIFTTILVDRYYYSYFTDDKIEAKWLIFLESNS